MLTSVCMHVGWLMRMASNESAREDFQKLHAGILEVLRVRIAITSLRLQPIVVSALGQMNNCYACQAACRGSSHALRL